MLAKIVLALALAFAAIATAASYKDRPTAVAGMASGGGNLVPVW
jgi:hypothetical protein